MMAAAVPSRRSCTGCRPAAARSSTMRFWNLGKNSSAISRWTRHTSAALHTLGRLHLAFSRISRAIV